MPKGAIHYTGTNFSRLRRLDVVSRVRALTHQRMMQRPQWLTYAERAPPLELSSLHLKCRRVHNTYLALTRELLQKYPDVRFQDCFVEGNDPVKGLDTFRADHPAMQFVALQLRLMNQGVPKAAAFKKAEEAFRERRAALERSQKVHMASAIAAAAALDPAAAAGAAMPASSAPLSTAEGIGSVQPMFTSGGAYWQMEIARSQMKHLLHIRRVLRQLRDRAEQANPNDASEHDASSSSASAGPKHRRFPSLRQRAFSGLRPSSRQPRRGSGDVETLQYPSSINTEGESLDAELVGSEDSWR
ncbi:uncharacterized protein LOC34619610 [Cyclospora cayetanensis]|uniref:Uncharacterized protein LOC34619610 n=1 Tax=Cyclospora cayetanensis TaxID=88456 RepID=A0A6P6RWW7_9EIME|nr:uncharacterized protein LOC34619610 [Cyclospora cayetanensis]